MNAFKNQKDKNNFFSKKNTFSYHIFGILHFKKFSDSPQKDFKIRTEKPFLRKDTLWYDSIEKLPPLAIMEKKPLFERLEECYYFIHI